MATRAVGPGAAFGWLKQAVNLGRENPRAVLGAIALLALVAMIPSALQLALGLAAGTGPEQGMMVAGLLSLAMIVIYPLLIGGVLRVIHASEHRLPTHATALFDTFRAGNGRGRLIGFGVLIAVVYIAVLALLMSLFGGEFLPWYAQVAASGMAAGSDGQPPAIPALPDGFGTVMALSMLVSLFFGGVYAIGFGQIALADHGVRAALVEGAVGTLKNLLPILLLAVVSLMLLFALSMVVVLLAEVLKMIGGLVHPALAALLQAPIYLGMLLVMYVMMFGVMYFMWRDICSEHAGAAPLTGPGNNQVEL